jgi:hypothetical protein
MARQSADMTRAVDLTKERGAGPVRTSHPQWLDLLPPCNNACPAGEDIQAWLALAQAGKYRQAWDVLMRDNPMPAVHGRVCYHPCEGACNRNELGAAVSIHAVERFLGDMAADQGWLPSFDAAASGKRVLVVGAGPSGLSAAYHLTRLGHIVEIHEAGPVPGGMMQFGIPAYRLPRADLMKEIARIERMGVRIVLNRRVEDLVAAKQAGGFDAMFVAIGAGRTSAAASASASRRPERPPAPQNSVCCASTTLGSMKIGATGRLFQALADSSDASAWSSITCMARASWR